MLSIDEIIKRVYGPERAAEELKSLRENESATLYMIVKKGKGSDFGRIIGFGIVYLYELTERWRGYKDDYEWINDKEYGMIVINIKTPDNFNMRFRHFSDEIFVLEGIAHVFRPECNGTFITLPGSNNKNLRFIDHGLIGGIARCQDLVEPLRLSIIEALKKNIYVSHNTAPPKKVSLEFFERNSLCLASM
jgi:hypothetical protein